MSTPFIGLAPTDGSGQSALRRRGLIAIASNPASAYLQARVSIAGSGLVAREFIDF
jgi:hypothetical protein